MVNTPIIHHQDVTRFDNSVLASPGRRRPRMAVTRLAKISSAKITPMASCTGVEKNAQASRSCRRRQCCAGAVEDGEPARRRRQPRHDIGSGAGPDAQRQRNRQGAEEHRPVAFAEWQPS